MLRNTLAATAVIAAVALAGPAAAGDFKAEMESFTIGKVDQAIDGGKAEFKDSTVNVIGGGTVVNARTGANNNGRTELNLRAVSMSDVQQRVNFNKMHAERSTLNFLAAGTVANLY